MRLDAMDSYTAYSAAWNQGGDAMARGHLLDRGWASAGTLVDPESPDGVIGRDALSEYIAATHEEMPGLVISETSRPEILGGRLKVSWQAVQNGEAVFTGTDFVEFDEDGRILRLTMFYDSSPDEANGEEP